MNIIKEIVSISLNLKSEFTLQNDWLVRKKLPYGIYVFKIKLFYHDDIYIILCKILKQYLIHKYCLLNETVCNSIVYNYKCKSMR